MDIQNYQTQLSSIQQTYLPDNPLPWNEPLTMTVSILAIKDVTDVIVDRFGFTYANMDVDSDEQVDQFVDQVKHDERKYLQLAAVLEYQVDKNRAHGRPAICYITDQTVPDEHSSAAEWTRAEQMCRWYDLVHEIAQIDLHFTPVE